MKLPGLTIFFPYLDDSGALETMLAACERAGRENAQRVELLVVDDGSAPEEAAALDEAAARFGARVIRHPRTLGYGAAVRRGLAESALDWVFYTDGDAQYDPLELCALVALWRADPSLDFINGWKKSRADAWPRVVLGAGYRALTRAWFGLPVQDVNCDFRLVRGPLARSLGLRCEGGGIGLELVRSARKAGARFAEAPVSHRPRRYGRSSFFNPAGVARLARELLSQALDR